MNPLPPAIVVGAFLKDERTRRGLSLRDVEEKTGVSNATISNIETGETAAPGFFTVATLCNFYGLSLDSLLFSTTEDSKYALYQEPTPNGEGTPIAALVERDLSRRHENADGLAHDIWKRAEHGKEEYGEYLRPNNGRRPLVDAYQEVLDAIVYLRQSIEEGVEGFPVEAAYHGFLEEALWLRVLIQEKHGPEDESIP